MTFLMLGVTWTVNWIRANKRVVAILAAIGLIALLAVLFTRSCGRKPVKLNEAELQVVNEAIETKERKKMEDAFVVIDVKQKEIDANVAYSENRVVNAQFDAKKKVQAMSDEELAAFLEANK